MTKLSVIIPSRDEQFLTKTIDDIFRNARGEIEVVTVLDSDKWPGDWKEISDRHPNLHTVHNGSSLGMRESINRGVRSAISRGVKFIMKSDAHCSFSEGFDEILKAECDDNWVVVPRRGRLDPENWIATETQKPDIDYHYLSFPDDPNDFGGPGLNGKPWAERAIERKDILLDDEMSSQGSCWFMRADFFNRLGLMDESSYGPFWNEFQEIGMCAWLSGGAVKVNKKAKYLHLHKGSKYGRGYRLNESWLQQGRNHTMKWIFNEAWDSRQIRPFEWLIDHFWPVPSWPENWREVLYATRKPRTVRVLAMAADTFVAGSDIPDKQCESALKIHKAYYGIGDSPDKHIDVTERLQSLVRNNSLDIVVNNSTLVPDQNPFRGKKKTLRVRYSIDGGSEVVELREEKDWLIIGPIIGEHNELSKLSQVQRYSMVDQPDTLDSRTTTKSQLSLTAPALNDYLIRRFQISPQRLRGPMPIELRDFHRNDLAQLFAELGFKRGAEIGVAEGNYSEVLLKANPECELLLVDPWHAYSDNPQNKSKEKHEYAFNEMRRKTEPYKNVSYIVGRSMDVIFSERFKSENVSELDFCYIDGNHLFDYVMQDLIEWSKRVRSGGIVSGDDYYALDQKRWVGGGVVEAVQAYTNAHRIPIWYLFAGHKSVDFMWVKP